MVAKLSQLTSLLSSIEDKVLTGVLRAPLDFSLFLSLHQVSKSQVLHLYDSLIRSCCPQVKALLHEGSESTNRRSLIPPVTFEVSDSGAVESDLKIYHWGAIVVLGKRVLLAWAVERQGTQWWRMVVMEAT